jgi:hypothetical protein
MWRSARGQASPEWLGLVVLVSLAFTAAVASGVSIPGLGLVRAVAQKLVCAAGLGDGCGGSGSDLIFAYGPELASMVAEHAPQLDYEEGMRAVPVDFRSCRDDACAEGADSGPVSASLAGEPVTLFSHVIDCRDPEAAGGEGYDCSGGRAGRVYLQFWAYYPGSQTSRALFGAKGFHPDDWESFSVRIGEAAEARASSHHGYNGAGADPVNDTGILGGKSAWAESSGHYLISGGSHAGRVGGSERTAVRGPRWLSRGPWRWTRSGDVRIVPIESLRDRWGDYAFEVTPPWAKEVFRDPEWRGT